ncbi:M48 metallopeptidase family protein [Aliamphritea hakodatensis]|uniref:M48 metallopeptidase family protein n=1 Tax=Aliamphritea hakodatensis TaxID=2895352 RepID=UPI0022FD707D|nr:M48 family metallopeptidase [Aliamphritea hakodatensis]
MSARRFLNGYPVHLQEQAESLLQQNKLDEYLSKRYRPGHEIRQAKALYGYAMDIKQTCLRQSPALSKVIYDDKIDVIHNALGLHTQIARVQGNKLKSKREIRVASLFRDAPEPFLKMIVVHELAHLREKDHNKAFYKLCCHMEPDYHQLELDLRLYLTLLDHQGHVNW